MKDDEVRWDSRYQLKTFPDKASDLVKHYCHLAKVGRSIDIAAGNGRNAVFLSDKGFEVDAVDISKVALDLIRKKSPHIRCLQEDLDSFTPEPNRYDLITNINYLNRRLFPHLKRALRNNGILIFKTFLDSHFEKGPQPNSNRDHYLQSNELLHAFLSLQIVHYSEIEVIWSNGERREAAQLIARKIDSSDRND